MDIKFTYNPMPYGVTVAPSNIAGNGIHALKHFPAMHNFGITHHTIPELVRTPLGGFLNHSTEPNAALAYIDNAYILYAIKPILANTEITVCYSLEQ